MTPSAEGQDVTWENKVREAFAGPGWFAGLPEDVKSEIAQHARRRVYKAGKSLYEQGGKPDGIFGILSGAIHTIGHATDGNQVLLSVLKPGEWTGFIGAFDDAPHSFSTVATDEVVTAFVPMAAVRACFMSSSDRMKLLSLPMAAILRFAYGFLTETNGRAPPRVVAQRLMDLSHSLYIPGTLPTTELPHVNQDDIAAATYLTRPTVNRVLKKFASQGIIKLGYGSIEILDIPALFAIASPNLVASAPPSETRPTPVAQIPRAVTRQIGRDRIKEVLNAGAWFSQIPEEYREGVLDHVTVRSCAAGEIVFGQGSSPDSLIGVYSGGLKHTSVGTDRGRLLVSLIHPGEWTGFLSAIDGQRQSLACTTSRSSLLIYLPFEVLHTIMGANPECYRAVVMPIILILRQIYSYLININNQPPLQLVAQRLYDLSRIAYWNPKQPRDQLAGISQADIAEATGLSRPSVNKVMSELSKTGAIETGYGRINILNPDELLRQAQARRR